MRRIAGIAVVFVFGLFAEHAAAQEGPTASARFQAANAHYFAGRFDEARAGYRELVELGIEDADVYYNLGLAEARRHEYGRAIAALENSLRIGGRQGDALQALETIRGNLGARRAEQHGEATVSGGESFLELIFSFSTRNSLAILTLVFAVLAAFFVLALLFAVKRVAPKSQDSAQLACSLGAAVCVGGSLFCLLGVLTLRGTFSDGQPAVVVDETHLLEGPSATAAQRGEVFSGERAYIAQQDGQFVRVRLDGGREGWLPVSAAERLMPHR